MGRDKLCTPHDEKIALPILSKDVRITAVEGSRTSRIRCPSTLDCDSIHDLNRSAP